MVHELMGLRLERVERASSALWNEFVPTTRSKRALCAPPASGGRLYPMEREAVPLRPLTPSGSTLVRLAGSTLFTAGLHLVLRRAPRRIFARPINTRSIRYLQIKLPIHHKAGTVCLGELNHYIMNSNPNLKNTHHVYSAGAPNTHGQRLFAVSQRNS